MAQRAIYINGQRYGRLVVLKEAAERIDRKVAWECRCDCGNHIIATGTDLRAGKIKSCGCLNSEKSSQRASERNYRHGGRNTRLYHVYDTMKQRCSNPNNKQYKNYGGRGITVCPEWENSFETFREWAIGAGYDENAPQGVCTIDRIDVNGNYCPENCRWADMVVQNNNKRK